MAGMPLFALGISTRNKCAQSCILVVKCLVSSGLPCNFVLLHASLFHKINLVDLCKWFQVVLIHAMMLVMVCLNVMAACSKQLVMTGCQIKTGMTTSLPRLLPYHL